MELIKTWIIIRISNYIDANFDDDCGMVVDFDDHAFNHDLKEFVKRNKSIMGPRDEEFDVDKFSDYIRDNHSMFFSAYYVTYDAIETEVDYDNLERFIDEIYSTKKGTL